MAISRAFLLKTIDATVGLAACRILGHVNASNNADQTAPAEEIQRILLIRPGGMGDMLLLIPVIRAIAKRYPAAAIDIVCEKRNAQVLKMAAIECTPLLYDARPFNVIRHLVKHTYDIAIDTEQFHNLSAIVAYISNAPVRIGFKINPLRNPIYTHLINYAPDGSELLQFMRLVAPLAISSDNITIIGTLSEPVAATKNFPSDIASFMSSNRYAVIHAGCSSPLKQWLPQNFAAVLKELHLRYGLSAIIVGDSTDRTTAQNIVKSADAFGCQTISAADRLSISDTANVIKHSSIFIGSDSGLAHLATALDVPSVVLFGPTDHLKWGYKDNRHAIVYKKLPCAPCFIFGYHRPCKNNVCMKNIRPEDVLAAVDQVLQ
ncbi:MAG: glycosyltransferase family 9 protein [Lentisphaerae bacterium]|nr:glycosyltransferase family 9 protein [Lentisphaerota bacterium]